jgi:hypothetical protein
LTHCQMFRHPTEIPLLKVPVVPTGKAIFVGNDVIAMAGTDVERSSSLRSVPKVLGTPPRPAAVVVTQGHVDYSLGPERRRPASPTEFAL